MEITVWIVNWFCILIIFTGLVILGKQIADIDKNGTEAGALLAKQIADIDRNGTEAGARTMLELQNLRETVREIDNPDSGGFAQVIKMIETKCK